MLQRCKAPAGGAEYPEVGRGQPTRCGVWSAGGVVGVVGGDEVRGRVPAGLFCVWGGWCCAGGGLALCGVNCVGVQRCSPDRRLAGLRVSGVTGNNGL